MRCPKCALSEMTGPRYVEGGVSYWGEALEYRCPKCGYVSYKPTADSFQGNELLAMQRCMAQAIKEKKDEVRK